MGEIGIPRKEFLYELKLWEIKAIIKGYRRRARTQWESIRWQTFYIVSSLGAKLNSAKDLAEFPWDKEYEERVQLSDEEIKFEQDLIAEINKQNEENRPDSDSLL